VELFLVHRAPQIDVKCCASGSGVARRRGIAPHEVAARALGLRHGRCGIANQFACLVAIEAGVRNADAHVRVNLTQRNGQRLGESDDNAFG